jgi:hypothetical protein
MTAAVARAVILVAAFTARDAAALLVEQATDEGKPATSRDSHEAAFQSS